MNGGGASDEFFDLTGSPQEVTSCGETSRATPDEPQYEIKSDKTDHVALHKAGVLRRLG